MDETRDDALEQLRGRCTCSIDTAAKILGIGRSTAYSAAHDGSLPTLRLSNRLLVSVPRLLLMISGEQASAVRRCDCEHRAD